MPKPVCVPCRRFFRMKKSGFYFTEGMPVGSAARAEPGNTDPDSWEPYKVWSSDKWVCEGCRAEILCGFGQSPIAERHHEDFERLRERLCAGQLQVNDC